MQRFLIYVEMCVAASAQQQREIWRCAGDHVTVSKWLPFPVTAVAVAIWLFLWRTFTDCVTVKCIARCNIQIKYLPSRPAFLFLQYWRMKCIYVLSNNVINPFIVLWRWNTVLRYDITLISCCWDRAVMYGAQISRNVCERSS